jgi:hypothetical protein
MYKTALMTDNVWIFLPLLLYGIAVVLGLCLCYLAAPRHSATDPRRAGAERPDRPRQARHSHYANTEATPIRLSPSMVGG